MHQMRQERQQMHGADGDMGEEMADGEDDDGLMTYD